MQILNTDEMLKIAKTETCYDMISFLNGYSEKYIDAQSFIVYLEDFINDIKKESEEMGEEKGEEKMLKKIKKSIDNLKNQ